jgi:tetratricopeptide (TPR) repeat protein
MRYFIRCIPVSALALFCILTFSAMNASPCFAQHGHGGGGHGGGGHFGGGHGGGGGHFGGRGNFGGGNPGLHRGGSFNGGAVFRNNGNANLNRLYSGRNFGSVRSYGGSSLYRGGGRYGIYPYTYGLNRYGNYYGGYGYGNGLNLLFGLGNLLGLPYYYGYGYPGYFGKGYGYYGNGYYGNGYYSYPGYSTYTPYSGAAAAPATNYTYSNSNTVIPTSSGAASYEAAAEQAFREHRYNDAARNVDHAIVEDNGNGRLYLFASQVLFALGDYQASAAALQRGVGLLDRDDWGYVVQNYAKFYRGSDYVTQMNKLVEFIDKNPDAAYAHFLRGYHYVYLNHTDAARKELAKAVKLEPRDKLAAELLKQVGGTAPEAAQPDAAKPPTAPTDAPASGVK